MREKIKKSVQKFGGIALLGAVLFYVGFQAGASNPKILITDSKQIIDQDFSLFWEAVDLLKQKHVRSADTADQEYLYGSIKGAVGALNDPYSEFFPPSDAKKFEQDLSGSFGGIGAEIGMKNRQILIISPLKGNPAERAGLQAGDKIFKIDDEVTTGLEVEDAVKKIRGEIGTKVKLLIYREGWDEAREFIITRKVVVVPTLDWSMEEGGIAVIHLHNFNSNASTLFYEAAVSALVQGVRGIVLDLRNNPGGFLDTSVNLASWFMEKGEVVVREKFKSGAEEVLRTYGNGSLKKFPVVVLVNGGSASASEILAGALRDNRGAKLVGEQTYGKGSVQELQSLSDGSTLKVTIATWYTPKGNEIDKKGLTPDIEVKVTDEDREKQKDTQLDKALEILRSQLR